MSRSKRVTGVIAMDDFNAWLICIIGILVMVLIAVW